MKKNPFKEIRTDKEVPLEMKKKVLNEIAALSLASEFADLFTVKFVSVFESLFPKNKK